MLTIEYKDEFLKRIAKIKDASLKEKVKKHVQKIADNPEIGKPMRYSRKGTREVYTPPFRLAYAYLPATNKIIFLDLYHKDEQ
ncbi:MAG: type II toxin-antitoxin system RelE/ParE family toxin [Nanoarchaeota archaeon]